MNKTKTTKTTKTMKTMNAMKFILAGLMVTSISFFSQGQAWEKGDINIDAYYGYVGPGLVLRLVDELSGDNSAGQSYNPQTSVLGPVGLRVQYMVAPRFGIGLDINYESKKQRGTTPFGTFRRLRKL